MSKQIAAVGNKQERELFDDVMGHYDMACEDLDSRLPQMDKNDELFRSYINKTKWPYKAIIFDPRVFTIIVEKVARQFANKPKGRMVPREGGDTLGAKINNELLSFQWDDNARVDDTPMIIKWAMMGMKSRRYGDAYGLVKWRWQRQVLRSGAGEDDKRLKEGKSRIFYDGPDFRSLNNRDCLVNPSYSTVKNWFQHRDYVTWQELVDVNDIARSKPVYKNLDILKEQMLKNSKKGGDTRESNWQSKNLAIKGLSDYLGRDEVFKTLEIITEYRDDRWITFSPKHGIILRDTPNRYNHGQIPIVQLKYIPVDEDRAGISEIEPVEKLQKAINAIVSQYIDAVNMSLYTPLKVRKTGGAVQMHTLEFGMGAKWMMDDPQSDVVAHDQNITGVTEFATTYRFLVSAMQEAMGESSQGLSNLVPGQEGRTAAEIKDTALQRNVRDNFNQIFLAEAIKKQMGFWHSMNQQFLLSNPNEHHKVIRIVGKDAIKFFQGAGLDGEGLTETGEEMLMDESLAGIVQPRDFMEPIYPVERDGQITTKLQMDEGGTEGDLVIEKQDLMGNYDFIPDIESMSVPDDAQMISAARQMIETTLNPQAMQILMQEGYTIKLKDLLEDYFEKLGYKDADKYFEKLRGGVLDAQNQGVPAVQAGAGGVEAGAAGGGNVQPQGMAGGSPAISTGQAQPIVS